MPNLIEYHHGLDQTGVQDFGLVMFIVLPLPLGLNASNTLFGVK
jgi:hypothetical protein